MQGYNNSCQIRQKIPEKNNWFEIPLLYINGEGSPLEIWDVISISFPENIARRLSPSIGWLTNIA